MQLIFDSMTGNTRRFACKVAGLTGLEAVALADADPHQPYLLLTYTFGSGAVPDSTASFLGQHGALMRGVVSSGSFHWGDSFGRAGDMIAAQYGVPYVARVNKSGNAADVQAVADWLGAYVSHAAD
ncbi:class Ib ribonucleoside-diphosphate reductase assembly flavoprotein NrdI [Deinococcus radiophilus]|uniref:Class Ib ribonucleoside-diphosphate reductase assembly flavoprotein NrdI n=1 Tax=Deinococcus radiophilus TaxID=32062 RepID=A0A3S0L2E6_9DEIO|nr:class Ib ribonucleoside-diphosphate reductase assembly flavoprotein NrdI [Deinococcus radiophilus]RTR25380.1 class Ib ribonucleoside-diphosphate reductase assembly flavoprotein NrdI [Deinococcus radiophilus]UFA51668.1 class Ib ribonucleoside-diphosphate reductase assembly flavoprotein NrdI [Deinococcus radiophilus]